MMTYCKHHLGSPSSSRDVDDGKATVHCCKHHLMESPSHWVKYFQCQYMEQDIALWYSSDRSVMVDPLNDFPFQPVLHTWCKKGCGMWYPFVGWYM